MVFDNRLVFPPFQRLRRVLDCGYGSGLWAAEVARQNPNCQVSHSFVFRFSSPSPLCPALVVWYKRFNHEDKFRLLISHRGRHPHRHRHTDMSSVTTIRRFGPFSFVARTCVAMFQAPAAECEVASVSQSQIQITPVVANSPTPRQAA